MRKASTRSDQDNKFSLTPRRSLALARKTSSFKYYYGQKQRRSRNNGSCDTVHAISMKREVKVARSIVFIVLAFLFAWLPYALVTLYAQYAPLEYLNPVITPYTTSLPSLCAKMSSVYNPILYVLTNEECRGYFKSKFAKKRPEAKVDLQCTNMQTGSS